ncbi:protein ORF2 [Lake sturgeon herpesvirus]|nr:protein ORF2 [Lake sturgeon herpesvirus]
MAQKPSLFMKVSVDASCTCLERETPRWALTTLLTDWQWGLLMVTPSPQCWRHTKVCYVEPQSLLAGLVRDVTLLCGARPVKRPLLANRMLYRTPVSSSCYVVYQKALEGLKALIVDPLCRDLVSRLSPFLCGSDDDVSSIWLGPCLETRLNLQRAHERLTQCPLRGPEDSYEAEVITHAVERATYTPNPCDQRVLCLCRHMAVKINAAEPRPGLWPVDGSLTHVSAELYADLEARLREKGHLPVAFADLDRRWGPRFNPRGKRVTAEVYLTAALLARWVTGVEGDVDPAVDRLYLWEKNVWEKIGRVLKRTLFD